MAGHQLLLKGRRFGNPGLGLVQSGLRGNGIELRVSDVGSRRDVIFLSLLASIVDHLLGGGRRRFLGVNGGRLGEYVGIGILGVGVGGKALSLQPQHSIVLNLGLLEVDLGLTKLSSGLGETGLGLNHRGLSLSHRSRVDGLGLVQVGPSGRQVGLSDGDRTVGLHVS